MILNGLGFVSAPLYLFEKFFIGKATEHLLGKGIHPEHLNDERLGQVLNKLYSKGLTEVFVTVAIDNQLGKPTAAPTLRWVFQCFLCRFT